MGFIYCATCAIAELRQEAVSAFFMGLCGQRHQYGHRTGCSTTSRQSQRYRSNRISAAFNNDVLTPLTAINSDAVIAKAAAQVNAAMAKASSSSASASAAIAAMIASTNELSVSQGVTGQIVTGQKTTVTPAIYQTVDRWGNVTAITDSRNPAWATVYQYNSNNQVTLERKPIVVSSSAAGNIQVNPETRTYYDKLGRTIATRDANGNLNGMRYDLNGRLLEELHADGGIVRYTFNTFGDRIKVAQANGTLTAYA